MNNLRKRILTAIDAMNPRVSLHFLHSQMEFSPITDWFVLVSEMARLRFGLVFGRGATVLKSRN